MSDTTPLSPEARSLIDDASGCDAASTNDKERVRGRLVMHLGVAVVGVAAAKSAGVVASATTIGASAKGAGALASGGSAMLIARLVAGLVAVTIVSTIAIVVKRRDVDATRNLPNASTMTGGAEGTAPESISPNVSGAAAATEGTLANGANGEGATGVAERATGAAATAAAPAITPDTGSATTGTSGAIAPSSQARAQTPHAIASTVGPSTPWPAPVGVASGAQVEGEAALLRRAQTASDSGDGVTALAALDTHERIYPNGVLAGQREGERVVAMCAMGQVPAARAAGARFVEAHPRASQAARVRHICRLP